VASAARARRQSSTSSFGEKTETCPGARAASRLARSAIEPVGGSPSAPTSEPAVFSNGMVMLQAPDNMAAKAQTAAINNGRVAHFPP
jgi:hypothetical protein